MRQTAEVAITVEEDGVTEKSLWQQFLEWWGSLSLLQQGLIIASIGSGVAAGVYAAAVRQ